MYNDSNLERYHQAYRVKLVKCLMMNLNKTVPVIRQNDFSGYLVDGIRNIYSGNHGIGPCTHDHRKQSEKSDGNSSNNN